MEKYWVMSNIDVYEILCSVKTEKHRKTYGKMYGKEDVIYLENEQDRNIYLVSSGKVKLVNYDQSGNEIIRHIVNKGEIFGEYLLLGEAIHDEFAVTCSNKTTICDVNIDTLRKLMGQNANLSATIYQCVASKMKKMNRRLDLLIGKDVTTRIIAFIYDMHKDHQTVDIQNPMTQQEIACLLATSRESVVRVFNDLKVKGIITYSRKYIYIKDLDSLKQMSGE